MSVAVRVKDTQEDVLVYDLVSLGDVNVFMRRVRDDFGWGEGCLVEVCHEGREVVAGEDWQDVGLCDGDEIWVGCEEEVVKRRLKEIGYTSAQLKVAVEKEDATAVDLILTLNPSIATSTLQIALQSQNEDICRLLFTKGTATISFSSIFSRTCHNEYHCITKLLLDDGYVTMANVGTYPLRILASGGHTELLVYLISVGWEWAVDGSLDTPLRRALLNRREETAAVMVEDLRHPVCVADIEIAAKWSLRLTKLMLGNDQREQCSVGNSLLNSVTANNFEITEYLVKTVGKAVDLGPALFAAASKPDPRLTSLLLDHDAAPNYTNPRKETPLISSADNPPCLKLILDAGGEVDHVPSLGSHTALTSACIAGNVESVEMLLEAGADPKKHSGYGKSTPLSEISKKNTDAGLEIATLLLSYGAPVNTRGDGNKTPLMLAAERGCLQIVALLLAHSPQLELAAGPYNEAAYAMAVNKGHEEVAGEIENAIQRSVEKYEENGGSEEEVRRFEAKLKRGTPKVKIL